MAATIESFRTSLNEDAELSELFGEELKSRIDELKCGTVVGVGASLNYRQNSNFQTIVF